MNKQHIEVPTIFGTFCLELRESSNGTTFYDVFRKDDNTYMGELDPFCADPNFEEDDFDEDSFLNGLGDIIILSINSNELFPRKTSKQ